MKADGEEILLVLLHCGKYFAVQIAAPLQKNKLIFKKSFFVQDFTSNKGLNLEQDLWFKSPGFGCGSAEKSPGINEVLLFPSLSQDITIK